MHSSVKIERYSPRRKQLWERFVDHARQRNLIFSRDYIDYHGPRFTDCSLLAWRGEKLLAILPCEIEGTVATSHRGLSFGGWITPPRHFTLADMEEIFSLSLRFLKHLGVSELIYRPVASPYCSIPADEDKWVLSRTKAQTLPPVLHWIAGIPDFPTNLGPSARWRVNKARDAGVNIRLSDDFEGFWDILLTRLREKYSALPVHSLEEIKRLKSLFPDRILLYSALSPAGEWLAGTVIYQSSSVIKAQYIATTPLGRKIGVLPMLFCTVCADFPTHRFLDLGSCQLPDGTVNQSLAESKYALGARPVAAFSYRIIIP